MSKLDRRIVFGAYHVMKFILSYNTVLSSKRLLIFLQLLSTLHVRFELILALLDLTKNVLIMVPRPSCWPNFGPETLPPGPENWLELTMKSFGTDLVQGLLKGMPERIRDIPKTLSMISSFSILFLFSIFSCTFVVYCYLFCVISKVISSDPNLNPAPEIKLTQLHFNRLPTNSRGQKVKNTQIWPLW